MQCASKSITMSLYRTSDGKEVISMPPCRAAWNTKSIAYAKMYDTEKTAKEQDQAVTAVASTLFHILQTYPKIRGVYAFITGGVRPQDKGSTQGKQNMEEKSE